MKRKIKTIFTLLKLLHEGTISYNYFKNYNFDEQRIWLPNAITADTMYYSLEFHIHLQLIGEDVYKVINTDNTYVNSIIRNPINNGLYKYIGDNPKNKDHFELILHS